MANILIVDDEQSYRQLLSMVFESDGHAIRTARNGKEGVDLIQEETPDVIISDVRMPDMDGIELLREARELQPDIGVILMTAFATVDTAREAFILGADDFIQKPFDVPELKLIVSKTLEKQDLIKENRAFKRAQRQRGSVSNIVGNSDKMQAIFQMIETVAEVQSTVLVSGESGTGKELVARAIHDLSPRAEKPFISINCGAFTETLLESELFGYVKGAFTGANTNRKGLFEASNEGTIFLDEIGEMSTAMQVKLLRVLQERKVRPVGAHEEIQIDSRVIAATNRDLKSMIDDGSFREDLFYRISVIPISLPPLRDRKEDIKELADHFVKKFCAQTGREISISGDAMEMLEKYTWHGNVRELEHTIERAVALEREDEIQPERLPDHITNYNPERINAEFDLPDNGINLSSHLGNLEKTYVVEALKRTGGNQTKAAELLKMPVRSLRHLLDKHGIRSLAAQMRSAGE
ncbi:MAG: sigma-54-dependent Fis family transcriptional regulator [Acidobacteria bacterium]|nr:MAG: sigma-54-dependent Fis family transcriptional regulator [Acidobacteriota bacterium]REK02280.1 MAG: sigma-54-dependent Fis family transcriptional regulator [Acidobacteriota bacterium]REK13917.1 MAG: sigma-54-dependent Fis family transcriptional regulator [Acidobacteriota bacterium]REK41911.1 MAG: sigma-54-dependent Fis family transcriptional regulator [Acidobacteriota bacterium]